MDIAELLAFSVKHEASDLHLSAGLPPMIRVDGDIRRINVPALEHKVVHGLVYDIMNDKQRKDYEEFLETDFSFEIPGLARFRVNAFNQERGAGAVFRNIPSKVLTLEDLGCPDTFKDIVNVPRGLVLVTGPTGSGKSTTLAAMMDYKNDSEYAHILTIEDPIEFVHTSKKCLINQREVHRDTLGFAEAPGFRNGIAFPFAPYHFKHNRPYPLLEIPLVAMDTTFRSYQYTPLPEILPEVKSLLEEALKFRGCLTILWHNAYFSPHKFAGWREIYEGILQEGRRRNLLLISGEEVCQRWLELMRMKDKG